MNEDCLKLTTYFSERQRSGHMLLADALFDVYEGHGLHTSVLVRGVEGFGLKHHLRTDRLLTLSEDLPVVSIAVDSRERIEAALPDVQALGPHGLITLERARLLDPEGEAALQAPDQSGGGEAKLTVYVGRRARVDGRPAYLAIVDLLRERGIAGATVLLGVDGTIASKRRRARFFGRNAEVPLMIISVGDSERIAEVARLLRAMVGDAVMTLERVRVCKRDGERLAEPEELPATDGGGFGLWQKLMVYAGEQTHVDGRPLHVALTRRLREEGASGVTALRAIWGFHGRHPPHGDTWRSLRRNVPVLTVVVDTPPNVQRWFDVIDGLTPEHGLVTCETVPAFRAEGPESVRGGLRLAKRRE